MRADGLTEDPILMAERAGPFFMMRSAISTFNLLLVSTDAVEIIRPSMLCGKRAGLRKGRDLNQDNFDGLIDFECAWLVLI